jgi:hypothetical protein
MQQEERQERLAGECSRHQLLERIFSEWSKLNPA